MEAARFKWSPSRDVARLALLVFEIDANSLYLIEWGLILVCAIGMGHSLSMAMRRDKDDGPIY